MIGSSIGLAVTLGAVRSDLLSGAGSYDSASGWTLSGLAAIGSGKLSFSGTGRASRPVSIPAGGGTFIVTVTVLARSAGDVTFNFADNDAGTNASTQVFASRTPGVYHIAVTANPGNAVFRINGVSAYVGEIDAVTVR